MRSIRSSVTSILRGRGLLGRQTLLLVVLLWLGIVPVAVTYMLADRLVFASLAVPRPEEIAMVTRRSAAAQHRPFEFAVYEELTRVVAGEGIGLAATGEPNEHVAVTYEERLVGGQAPVVRFVSRNYFDVLEVSPWIGRIPTPAEASASVLISYRLWQELGSDTSLIGRPIRLNESSMTISGVLPRGFEGIYSGQTTDVWALLDAEPMVATTSQLPPSSAWLTVVTRVSEQQAWGTVEERLTRSLRALPIVGPIAQAARGQLSAELVPARRGVRRQGERASTLLPRLLGISITLLLSVGIGTGVLLTARLAQAESELRTRLALGATRFSLVRAAVVDVVVIVLLAGGLAVFSSSVSTQMALRALRLLQVGDVSVGPTVDARVLAAVGVCSAGMFVLLMSVVALRVWRTEERVATRASAGMPPAERRLLGGLVACQLALSLPLLFASFLMVATLRNIAGESPGFVPSGLVALRLPMGLGAVRLGSDSALRRELTEGLSNLGDVESVALTTGDPFAGLTTRSAVRRVDLDSAVEGVRLTRVDDRYFDTLAIRYQGASPSSVALSPQRIVWVSESLAVELWGSAREAVGQSVDIGSGRLRAEVGGVVGDVLHGSFRDGSTPEVYLPVSQFPAPLFVAVVKVGTMSAGSIGNARRVVSDIVGVAPVEIEAVSLEEVLSARTAPERVTTVAAASFATLSVVVMLLGLIGLSAWIGKRYRSEVALRVALGATYNQAEWPIYRGLIPTIASGLVCGGAASYASALVLRPITFNLSSQDFVAGVIGAASIMCIVIVSAGAPVWKSRGGSLWAILRAES